MNHNIPPQSQEQTLRRIIEQYARMAFHATQSNAARWTEQSESLKEGFRAGARVVFANAGIGVPVPKFDQCSECDGTFYFPVELHHDEFECLNIKRRNHSEPTLAKDNA